MERIEAPVGIPLPGWRALVAAKALVRRTGWGVVAIAGVLLTIGIFSPRQAVQSAGSTLHELLTLSPYLIAAFTLAGYMRAASVDVLVTRVFRGRPVVMIFAATAFGALTPLCSCSVVALIAVLLRSGTPLSAVMAFWIASPIISPDLFLYTSGVLGFELAAARMLAAVFMGVAGGLATLLVESMGGFRSPLRDGSIVRAVGAGEALSPTWRFWREPERLAMFFREFKSAAFKILPWMVVAFILESLMTAYVPTELVARWVGSTSAWAIPLSILVSMPTYVNPVAAVPLVAGFVSIGMTKPAALAFIVAGSVTTIPAMMAVLPLVRTRIFVWHILVGLVAAGIAAYTYQLYLSL
jgi:uncharacterized protein